MAAIPEMHSPERKKSGEREHNSDKPCRAELPVEIQMLILSHLPAEAVVRFRVVCKNWPDMFSTPQFLSLWGAHYNTSNAKSYFILSLFLQGGHSSDALRCHRYSLSTIPQIKRLPSHKLGSLFPEDSEPACSAAGLLLTVSRSCFWVGNPLTHQWVKVPPLQAHRVADRSYLLPYTSQGQMFFKVWIEPYLFDSKLGIWTLPQHDPSKFPQTISMRSHNTLQRGSISFTLGQWQHKALVLLALGGEGDFSTLSEWTWVHAWDYSHHTYFHTYMLEVGGKIGIINQQGNELVVLVLKSGRWCKVSILPKRIKRRSFFGACSSIGRLTFVCVGNGVAVFDSRSLTWEWVEEMSLPGQSHRMLLLEPSFTATPGLNVPSLELSKECVSKMYANARYIWQRWNGSFPVLEALRRRGMSWQIIGKFVTMRLNQGREFQATRLGEDEVVENGSYPLEDPFERMLMNAWRGLDIDL